MRNATRMMMLNRERDGRTDMRYPDMGYGMESRGRDYDRGREAPGRATRGTSTRDNTRGAESAYMGDYGGMNYPRAEMDEVESRRRRDSRGRFRSEIDRGNGSEMHYPDWRYPPPVYEDRGEMNRIGFSAHSGAERNNLHMIRGGASHDELELDDEMAYEWMENLQNEDGTKGPHWSMEQVKQLMAQKGWKEDPLRAWVALNIMYSDYCGVAKKVNANNIEFYVAMAKAFLEDKDAGAKDKLSAYYEHIVK